MSNSLMEDCRGDSIEYYLDSEDRLRLPKRPLDAVTHINKLGCRAENSLIDWRLPVSKGQRLSENLGINDGHLQIVALSQII
jgi:hypothetical protein